MPDRTVTYTFKGSFANLNAGLASAGRNVGELGGKMVALDRNGQKMRAGLTQLGGTAGKVGIVAAAGVAVAVRAAANFEQAMSKVSATGDEARVNIEALRDAAIEAGAATRYSATEAAGGIEALLKAGVSARDVLDGGLTGALNLAAAGELDVATAAEQTATALQQFKLSGEDATHVADLLAAGAGKSVGEVGDLGAALNQTGLVAAQMGISIEETTGVLAEFASNSLLGSDAGTSMRTMLLRLANPTKESADLMSSLGISAYNTSGQFVGLATIADQLQAAFEGKSQAERDSALATIFGSDAIRGASVLYAGGGEAVRNWTESVNDAGYAAEVAAAKQDNLLGDLEKLKGSFETLLIGSGEGAQGPFRGLVQGTTEAVNALGSVPGPAKSATTALLGVTAVLGSSLWVGSKIVNGIAATQGALESLGIAADTTRGKLALVTTGTAAAAFGIGTVLDVIGEMDARSRSNATLDATVKSFQDIADAVEFSNLGKNADKLGINIGRLTQDLAENGEQGEYVTRVLEQLGESSHGLGALLDAEASHIVPSAIWDGDAEQAGDALDDLRAIIEKLGPPTTSASEAFAALPPELKGLLGPLYGVSSAEQQFAAAVDEGTEANDDQKAAIRGAMQAMRDKREEALSAFDAETRYRQAVKDATEQSKKNEAGIKGSTDEALANRDALARLADGWNGLDNATKNASGNYKAARDNFIATAREMGVGKKVAEDLARELLEIPRSVETRLSTPGADESITKARTLKEILDQLHSKSITVALNYQRGENKRPDIPTPGEVAPDPTRIAASPRIDAGSSSLTGRLRAAGLDTISPRTGDLNAQASAKAALALGLLAQESAKAATSNSDWQVSVALLKDQLRGAQRELKRMTNSAQDAHNALDSLVTQRAGLASSVSAALSHDPFGGSLETFQNQTDADTADAQAVLAAMQKLVENGLDPHSALFQRLVASGNVSLIEQFAALSRQQLANEANRYAVGQSALNAAGSFAGDRAFNDLIAAAAQNAANLDGTVSRLDRQVNKLEKVLDRMDDKIEQGLKKGSEWVAAATERGSRRGSEDGTRVGNADRDRRTAAFVRSGGGSR